MAMVECKDCDYLYNENGEQECHRFPPKYTLDNPTTTGYDLHWPEVELIGERWACGEGVETV